MMFPPPFDQFYLSSLNLLKNSMTFDPHNRAADGWSSMDFTYAPSFSNPSETPFPTSVPDQLSPSLDKQTTRTQIHNVVAITTDEDTGSVHVDVVCAFYDLERAKMFCLSINNYLANNVSFRVKSTYLE